MVNKLHPWLQYSDENYSLCISESQTEDGIKVWDGIPNEAFVEPFMI